MKGTLFDIQSYSLHDGPGIRTCIFLKGCPLRCAWCHNPEGLETGLEVCPNNAMERVGFKIEAKEVVARVLRDRPFFDDSGGGVTLTGGEPTLQADFLFELLTQLREAGIHTAIETCGHFPTRLCLPLADAADLFLFDLKHADTASHREGTRAGNELILENFATLLEAAGPQRVVPRIPVIPGFNDDTQSQSALLEVLKERGYSGPVHLMPYHPWARGKYQRLGREPHQCGQLSTSIQPELSALFESSGMQAMWGA